MYVLKLSHPEYFLAPSFRGMYGCTKNILKALRFNCFDVALQHQKLHGGEILPFE